MSVSFAQSIANPSQPLIIPSPPPLAYRRNPSAWGVREHTLMAATLELVRGEGVWRGWQWEVAGAECGERGGLLSGSGRETAILGPISPQPTLTSVTSGQGMGGRHQLRGGAQPGPPAQPAGLRQPRERLLEVATGVVGIVWNGGEGGRNLLIFFNPVRMSRQVWGGGF